MKVYGTVLSATPSDRAKTGVAMGRQVRAVIAAPTQKVAAEAFGLSLYAFRQYAGETGNQQELAVALSKPGAVFIRGLDAYGAEYVER